MKLTILGSGSSGNCTYLSTGKTTLLIDAGFGIRSLRRRLQQAGLKASKVDGILVTHAHGDHIGGLRSLRREISAPIYCSSGTQDECRELLDDWPVEQFKIGKEFLIGNVSITSFSVSHDAQDAVGFHFKAEGIRGAAVIDTGEISPCMDSFLKGCDWLILESNHDEDLLRLGPYPWDLKRRVLSRYGHLSNQALADFLAHRYDGSAEHLFLAHLSRQNNRPDIALEAASRALSRQLTLFRPAPHIHLTHQTEPSIVLTV